MKTASVLIATVFSSPNAPMLVPTVVSPAAASEFVTEPPAAVSVAVGSAKPAGDACVAPLSLLTMPRTTITPAMASTMTPTTQRPLLGFPALSQPQPGPQQAEACCFGNSVFSGCFPSSFDVLIFISLVGFLFYLLFALRAALAAAATRARLARRDLQARDVIARLRPGRQIGDDLLIERVLPVHHAVNVRRLRLRHDVPQARLFGHPLRFRN